MVTDWLLLQRTFKRQISEPVELHLSVATSDMWDKVLTAFREILDKAESTYLNKARSDYHVPFLLHGVGLTYTSRF